MNTGYVIISIEKCLFNAICCLLTTKSQVGKGANGSKERKRRFTWTNINVHPARKQEAGGHVMLLSALDIIMPLVLYITKFVSWV